MTLSDTDSDNNCLGVPHTKKCKNLLDESLTNQEESIKGQKRKKLLDELLTNQEKSIKERKRFYKTFKQNPQNSPNDVTKASFHPVSTEVQETAISKLVPSLTKIYIAAWMFESSHHHCKYEPCNDIPESLRCFDVTYNKDGKEVRSPKLTVENGVIKPRFEYMKFESKCQICWHCEYCNQPLCCDPTMPSSIPCTPNSKKELLTIPEEWGHYDYVFYYLTKSHKNLSLLGIDTKTVVNRYRKDDLSGLAEKVFYMSILESENSIEVLEYIDNLFVLHGRWKDYVMEKK